LEAAGIDGAVGKPTNRQELFACVARVTGRLDVTISEEDRKQLETDAWGGAKDHRVETRAAADAEESEKLLSGTKVLLAEDHPVNRQVATTMLETLKCQVDVVVDGAQAAEAVQLGAYDIVFLDCQMPNVDGYEATRQIRRLEQQGQVRCDGEKTRSGHLPIVALTAHTAAADQALAFESGMDDFVSKPFSLQTLRGALMKWVSKEAQDVKLESDLHAPGPDLDVEGDTLINEASIQQILELDRLNGGGVFARFAHTFLDAVPVTLQEIQGAVGRTDASALANSAHALKGVCLNLGAESMAAVSRELEMLGKSGTTEGADSLLTKLDELYLDVKAELAERLEKYRATLPA
jgi:CheY-like chemotaxis protein